MPTHKQETARALYFQSDLSYPEIAKLTGVSAKTIYRWINEKEWKKLKTMAHSCPAVITDKLYVHMNAICNSISSRGEAATCTLDEAKALRMLSLTANTVKNQVTSIEAIQVMTAYSAYLTKTDYKLGTQLIQNADGFVNGLLEDRIFPNELEHSFETAEEPIDEENTPFFSEDPQEDAPAKETENNVSKETGEFKKPFLMQMKELSKKDVAQRIAAQRQHPAINQNQKYGT